MVRCVQRLRGRVSLRGVVCAHPVEKDSMKASLPMCTATSGCGDCCSCWGDCCSCWGWWDVATCVLRVAS